MILNIVTGKIKQPYFLSKASRFYSLTLDWEPPQNIIGWTKKDDFYIHPLTLCIFQPNGGRIFLFSLKWDHNFTFDSSA